MTAATLDPYPTATPATLTEHGHVAAGHTHGVCWAAIAAGALGAASLSLILLMLGVGLGLSSMSPWASQGASAETLGMSTIAWLIFTQLAASAMGGYLAGRLRSRWTATHGDEVYFRDTAHGFLAWSLATLVTAGLLGSAVGAILGGAKDGVVAASSSVAAGAAAASAGASNMRGMNDAMGGPAYFTDMLFRADAGAPAPAASSSDAVAPEATPTATPANEMPAPRPDRASPGEVPRIFMQALAAGALPPEDARYLAQRVAQRTGLSQADAEKRVSATFQRMQAQASKARQDLQAAADKARKASAMASLWMFISLLIGAFVAAFSATLGSRLRDAY